MRKMQKCEKPKRVATLTCQVPERVARGIAPKSVTASLKVRNQGLTPSAQSRRLHALFGAIQYGVQTQG